MLVTAAVLAAAAVVAADERTVYRNGKDHPRREAVFPYERADHLDGEREKMQIYRRVQHRRQRKDDAGSTG